MSEFKISRTDKIVGYLASRRETISYGRDLVLFSHQNEKKSFVTKRDLKKINSPKRDLQLFQTSKRDLLNIFHRHVLIGATYILT